MSKIFYLFIASTLLCSACAKVPSNSQMQVQQIKTDPGPEDLILDTNFENDRLLISCDDRRTEDLSIMGSILTFDLVSRNLYPLERKEEPEGLVFHPHGIDLQSDRSGSYLFVISHDDEAKVHQILKYKVEKNTLIFKQAYQNELMISPNSVVALSDGSFYFTNDSRKRENAIEALLKLKRSNVVYCQNNGECTIAAKRLSYANGLALEKETLYLSTTRQNKLFKYKRDQQGNLSDRETITKIRGMDNLRFHENQLITSGHLKLLKFLKHYKKEDKKAPSVVYQVDKNTGEKKVLFADDGNRISAASGGLIYKNKLYIPQVFDGFILEVPLEQTQ